MAAEQTKLDVFGAGQCALDHLGIVDAYPPADVKCEFTGLAVQGGGPVATALVALARWGRRCAFAGVTGDDGFGKRIRADLEAEGIDLQDTLVRRGGTSQFAFILAEPKAGRRTIFFQRPGGPAPGADEFDLSRIGSARILHTDGFHGAFSLACAREAKRAGVPVSVDAGTLREGMLELAKLADVFLASGTFARAYLARDDPLSACRKLATLGPRIVGVTRAEQGYVAIAEGRVIEGPAHRAEVVDTTGCGDVFHAGFLHGELKGWPAEKSLDFAAWAAGRVATKLGGRAGIPPVEEYG